MRIPTGLVLFTLLVLAACSGRSPEATPTQTPAPDLSSPEPLDVNGMPNTVRVGDLLFGGQPTPEALADLAARGYKTVLSTRGNGELKWDEKKQVESLDMAYTSIPMPYPIESITDAQVKEFAEFMDHAATPVVVHCGSGNRVAGLWAVWLAEREGVEPEKALELGARAGMTRIKSVVEKRLGVPSRGSP